VQFEVAVCRMLQLRQALSSTPPDVRQDLLVSAIRER